MKKLKNFLVLILVLVISISTTVSAFAVTSGRSEGGVTVGIGNAGAAGSVDYNIKTGEEKFVPAPIFTSKNMPAEVKQFIPSQALNKESDTANSRAIIGSDNRVLLKTLPSQNSNHCLIISSWPDKSTSQGTGFVVDHNKVMTAGHMVYNPNRWGWATSILVVPNQSTGDPLADGTFYASNMTVGGDFYYDNNYNDDWGLIFTDEDISSLVGWLGRKNYTADDVVGKSVTIAGYPGDKKNSTANYNPSRYDQYTANGKITKIFARVLPVLSHSVDTAGGQSGAPVYSYETDWGYTAALIHTSGIDKIDNQGILIGNWLNAKIGSWNP